MVTNIGTSTFTALLNGSVVESFSASTDTTSADNFFGFTGITFDEIRIDAGGNDVMALDNLQLGTTSVPEPTSMALLGLASISGIGLRLSQRRRAKVA